MEMTMILRGFVLVMGLAAATTAFTDDRNYYKAIPFKPLQVTKVVIDKPSEKSDLDAKEDCSTFIVTPARVREFFKNARSVSEYQRMHELDWSACYAEGKVEFSNHETASWLIARHGVGAMTFDTGKRKDKTIYLHCARCEEWRF